MTLSTMLKRASRIAIILASGTLMRVDMSCTGVGEKLTHSVNPCGTIFNCDPVEYDLLTTKFPDWSIDPSCTIPGQCATDLFPLGNGGTAAAQ